MTHASLFSGIGGFDLAAEWAGWTNVFNCEVDPFCRKVLKYHFPKAAQYEDIRTTDFTVWRDRIDVLTGGFPCQPFSVAGKRKGTGDDRYLWPEMLGAIREIRPRWVVGENVLGIVDWSEGLVFEQVCSDMENEGYEVQPFVLPACGVNAPHKRNRIWFVAHRADSGSEDMCQREDGLHAFGVYAHAYGIGLREWANEPESVEGRVRAADISACSANGDASANDARNVSLPPSQAKRDGGMVKTAMRSDEYRAGAGFQLNPLFVAEMMGFPADWTALPFQGGAGNPSKPTATP